MPKENVAAQLSQELLRELRELLDKPVSPKVVHQIETLLKHESIPIYKSTLSCL